jgi:hypothetical protein
MRVPFKLRGKTGNYKLMMTLMRNFEVAPIVYTLEKLILYGLQVQQILLSRSSGV